MPSLRSMALGSPQCERDCLAELPVLVLAGGLGTRLRSVYNDGPKVMAPVAARPFLSYLLRNLQRGGLRRVVLCVGYKHEQIESWAGDGIALGLELVYSVESEPLGTAGSLRLAANRYVKSGRLVAVNGDSLMQVDFAEMLDFHIAHSARATLALARVPDAARYGRVEVDERGWVRAFIEKASNAGTAFINGGIYIFQREIFDSIPAGRPVSLEREVLPALIGDGLISFPTNGDFIDIGVPEDFARAQAQPKELFHL
jgi:NDP-sugar pyrophosphorylase family protein